VSRRGEQLRRFGELVFGALTASRDELQDCLTGDDEAIDVVRERGAEILADVGGRVKRIAASDGSKLNAGKGSARVLNEGHKPATGPGAVLEAELVEDEEELERARRARKARP
jgi:hypothetical protein